MITIYDVAKKAGVSSTTVSKALNNYPDVSEKTRKAILDAAEEMGYMPNSHAQSLSTKKTWSIGVMFTEDNEVGMMHPFFNAVIESFRKHAEQEGYDLIFASRNLRNRNISYLEHFLYRGVDGVIIICSDQKDPYVVEILNSKIPLVVIDMKGINSSTVFSDNEAGGELAVDHFYSLGHRKIAHIAGSSDSFAGRARITGFMNGIKKHNLPLPDGYLVDGGMFSIIEGQHAMEKLLDLEDRPTAVFVAGDQMAIGAMEAVRNKGLKIPEDISIIGFDDIEMAKYVTPGLTTIKQDTEALGKQAGQLLVSQMVQKKKKIKSEIVPVTLVDRNSCQRLI
ncbi:LacI family DNA-binding transcriptional regulator [Fictibacillus fluitans]|uniref:LacI family DNA-binding transcriptional regulator n=1 Tax=Fictibacillus fluitans TaxID=3058422 RepID=A0ABT8HWB5_9BACL|nr:LacI family DNA-binding transcriptional regulator [Fictibacillus sp. NE201]MDN4525071.1 LacI family DNA-binding transcriptional regulator [Fictibacillus sp. NE201]